MKITNALLPLLLLLNGFLLTACSVPGMQMNEPANYNPALGQNDSVETPKLKHITPELVLKQQKQSAKARVRKRNRYEKPTGFTTNKADYEYEIGPQDVLNIVVWDTDSLTNPTKRFGKSGQNTKTGFTVNHEGKIYYPYIGYVHVAGLTRSEARDVIAEKLSNYLKKPQVTVQIVGFNSQRINVMGAVQNPQVIPVTNVPTTVLDAISQAGGPVRCNNALSETGESGGRGRSCADTQHVMVKQNGEKSIVDLGSLRSPTGSSENWILKDGSVIRVPNNNYYKVYVLGEVQNTGAFNMMKGQMTLREAVVASGGVNQGDSAPAYTYVIRGFNDNPRVFKMNLRSPEALLLAGEFALKPQDVVFVSTSNWKDMNIILQYLSPIISTFFSTAALGISAANNLNN